MTSQQIENEVIPNNGINNIMPSNGESQINKNDKQKEIDSNNNSNSNNVTNIEYYGLKPIKKKCQFCKNEIETVVHRETNWGSICLSFCTLGIWCCIQKCKKKEINFCIKRHQCPICGQLLKK